MSKMKNKPMRKIPELVRMFLLDYSGHLVGSASKFFLDETGEMPEPRDYDIFIPPSKWNSACRLIASLEDEVAFNSFGGLKIKLDNAEIDIWCSSLDDFLSITDIKSATIVSLRPYCVINYSK